MSNIVLGLDIGSTLIKAVEINNDKKGCTLLAAGYIAAPNNPRNSQEYDLTLANTVNRLMHNMKLSTNEVSASLPSAKVIARIIEVPNMSDKELSASLQWEAEQYIPWQLSQVKLDYLIMEQNADESTMKILLVAAPIALIERYMDLLKLAGLTPVSLEPDILSSARVLSSVYGNTFSMIYLSIGAVNTDISIVRKGSFMYGKSYPIGGNVFSKTVAEELGFEMIQAEEYKKTYGLDENALDSKIFRILSPLMGNIVSETNKTVSYFKEQYPNEEIKMAILGGGSARLPGLVTFFAKQTGLDTQVCNPFTNIKVDANILPIIHPDAPIYTNAVGLGIKSKLA